MGESHQCHCCHLAPPQALSENESVTLHLPGFEDGFGEIIAWDEGLFSCINDLATGNGSQWHQRGSAKGEAVIPG